MTCNFFSPDICHFPSSMALSLLKQANILKLGQFTDITSKKSLFHWSWRRAWVGGFNSSCTDKTSQHLFTQQEKNWRRMCSSCISALYFLVYLFFVVVALQCIGFLHIKFFTLLRDRENNAAMIILNVSLFTFEGKLLKCQHQYDLCCLNDEHRLSACIWH